MKILAECPKWKTCLKKVVVLDKSYDLIGLYQIEMERVCSNCTELEKPVVQEKLSGFGWFRLNNQSFYLAYCRHCNHIVITKDLSIVRLDSTQKCCTEPDYTTNEITFEELD